MDHLGFGKFHVMGGCIGGSYCFEAVEHDPSRVVSAVLQNPIGLSDNRDTWDDGVKAYAETVRARDPSITEETIESFGHNMFGGDFVFSVTREFLKNCATPFFLQPARISRIRRKSARISPPWRLISRFSMTGAARPIWTNPSTGSAPS